MKGHGIVGEKKSTQRLSNPSHLKYNTTHSATALRSLNRDAALDAHARQRMAQAGIRVLDVFDIVNPFRDCTVDGTHHVGGVAEAVAKHRVVPWLCEVAAGASG